MQRRKSELLINTEDKLLLKTKTEIKKYNNSENNPNDKNDIKNTDNNNNNNIDLYQTNQNIISNEPLYSLKETLICTFCGGKNCKHENFRNHKNPAIYGLNSDKIDNNIYASQRPSNSLIKKYNLISKFKELEIGLIVNLQLPGEHPYCGPDNLNESGFSYSPSLFESEGIHVGLYGWKDLDVPNSLNHMLQIVKAMYNIIHYKKKKVLVHCHAGLGRTGTTIACFKIFDEGISAEAAKSEIRKVRGECIQSKNQFNYCVKFQEFIRRLKGNFYLKETRSIENFLKNQEDLNIGKYKFLNFKYNKSVPIFIQYIFDAIIDIKNKMNLEEISLYNYLISSINSKDDSELFTTIIKNINEYNWDILYLCEEPSILGELLFNWLQNSIEYIFNPDNINRINDYNEYDKYLKTCENQTLDIICKFLALIKNNNKSLEDIEEKEKQKNIFIKKLCIYCLGFDKKKLNENDNNIIDKLFNLINYKYYKKYNDIENNINNNDDKSQILSNVYEQLKEYYEKKEKNKNKLILLENIKENEEENENDIFDKINNLMNSAKNLPININKKEKEIKINNKNIKMNNDEYEISNAGISLNESTIKLSKSMKINIKKNKSLFKDSFEILNEIDNDKDIPWIREEDC